MCHIESGCNLVFCTCMDICAWTHAKHDKCRMKFAGVHNTDSNFVSQEPMPLMGRALALVGV